MAEKDERYYKAYMEHKTISRRGLFRAFTSGTQKASADVSSATSSSRSLPKSGEAVPAEQDLVTELVAASQVVRVVARPPGALDEVLFQKICTGCSECESVCPEKIIHVADDLAQLDVDYGYCTMCGECQKTCPTGALHAKKPHDEQNDTELRPNFSTNCQNRLFGECELCAEQCPHQAISIATFSLPKLEQAKCDGCSRCKQACPFSVITMDL
ncbi:ferredoxin-type protein NapF [Photobacterium kagoshimensis]|uniref:ferredoxin-type protein NapF n=1 Tax=Photobacterium kagoshimensis TaxID=2910242 RepID=UPI003D0C514A